MRGPSARCLYCGRTVSTDSGRYTRHSITPKSMDNCPLSGQRVPSSGDGPDAYEARVHTVAHLAWQIRDEDPTVVWAYLTALDAGELQRLMLVALSGVRVDVPVDSDDSFGWLHQLDLGAAS